MMNSDKLTNPEPSRGVIQEKQVVKSMLRTNGCPTELSRKEIITGDHVSIIIKLFYSEIKFSKKLFKSNFVCCITKHDITNSKCQMWCNLRANYFYELKMISKTIYLQAYNV